MKNLIRSGAVIAGLCIALAGTKSAMAEVPTAISVQDSDAEILGVLAAIDKNEIHMARIAEQKNIDRPVLAYARMLDRYHNENLGQVRYLSQELGIPLVENTGSADQLRTNGEEDIATLSPLDQDDFSREFIWDMIRVYSDALTWIDSQDTQNDQVKMLLDDTIKRMARHLKKAQKIQEQVLK